MNGRTVKYIVCQGSGNRFAMIDGVEQADALRGADFGRLAAELCSPECATGGTDGLLMFVQADSGYAMRMFNPDGSEAEMCGNGIRCAARLARKYIAGSEFVLFSGGRPYRMACAEPMAGGVPAYGAEIGVETWSHDFGFFRPGESFAGKVIAPLDTRLRFTALSLGNPHITACVDGIDMDLLAELGERVKRLPELFPRGVNVSLYEHLGGGRIFVATCERGAGITDSCGTAMTASATAAALLGRTEFGMETEVFNRGGMVRCLPRRRADGTLYTRLTGNATYEFAGHFTLSGTGRIGGAAVDERFSAETEAYGRFAERAAAMMKRHI